MRSTRKQVLAYIAIAACLCLAVVIWVRPFAAQELFYSGVSPSGKRWGPQLASIVDRSGNLLFEDDDLNTVVVMMLPGGGEASFAIDRSRHGEVVFRRDDVALRVATEDRNQLIIYDREFEFRYQLRPGQAVIIRDIAWKNRLTHELMLPQLLEEYGRKSGILAGDEVPPWVR